MRNANKFLSYPRVVLAGALVALSLAGCSPKPAKTAQQHVIEGFDHYTFAVMWHPGVCATWSDSAKACTDKSPDSQINRQWTMHGLWASIPPEMSDKGVPPQVWWKYGCHWFTPGHELPQGQCGDPVVKLPADIEKRLHAQMPMTATCLERHEYYKHAKCVGFTPEQYFPKELDMLDKLNANSFTAWVREHRGQWVAKSDIQAAFAKGFGVDNANALELRCKSTGDEHQKQGDILTQAWFTIHADKVDDFPAADSLMKGRRGNCAAKIHILG